MLSLGSASLAQPVPIWSGHSIINQKRTSVGVPSDLYLPANQRPNKNLLKMQLQHVNLIMRIRNRVYWGVERLEHNGVGNITFCLATFGYHPQVFSWNAIWRMEWTIWITNVWLLICWLYADKVFIYFGDWVFHLFRSKLCLKLKNMHIPNYLNNLQIYGSHLLSPEGGNIDALSKTRKCRDYWWMHFNAHKSTCIGHWVKIACT
jgi:hypothetical protein